MTAPTTTSTDETVESDEKPTVLFVDDDVDVLEGLRLTLRSVRSRFRLSFANGADDALAMLDSQPVDVVVSDARMPGCNGAELLHEAAYRQPGTVRYVLSGQASEALILGAMPVAHRWFAKPLDRDALVAALDDAVHQRSVLVDPEVRTAVNGTGTMPMPSDHYIELRALLADPDAEIDDVLPVVASDPAIAAKLLQWANADFSGTVPVTDLRNAVAAVGLPTLSQLTLLSGIGDTFGDHNQIPGMDPELYRRHVDALVAVSTVGLDDPGDVERARTLAVLSMTGLLLAASVLPDRLAEAFDHAERNGVSLLEAEQTLHGINHAQLTGQLLMLWGLPAELAVGATESHGLPLPDGDAPDSPLEAVRRAHLLAQRMPHATRLGLPHCVKVDDELDGFIDGWLDDARSELGSDAVD
ncbi:MAG: HDOD domain-containing protein [Actinomycetota bacterium]